MSRRRTLIVGLGITGMSCVRYLHGTDEILVADTRAEPPGLALLTRDFPDVALMLEARRLDFSGVDRVLVSPGVALDDPLLDGLPEGVPLVSDVDLFCEAADAPIVAVTGTNGKSTVTSLTGHLLASAGLNAVVGGNLGDAALDLLDDAAAFYVLELSSFQLERLRPHHFLAATILNVTEDHLDRHGDLASYARAKQAIYRDCEVVLARRDDPLTFPAVERGLVTFGPDVPQDGHWGIRVDGNRRWLARGAQLVMATDALPVAGRHNELNAMAAMALAESCGVAVEIMAAAAESFTGLRHRCERVATVNGVEYIDDSKATNVGATRAALEGLGEDGRGGNILLIAGGDGKGADFSPLEEMVDRYVRVLLLLGRDAPKLAQALAGRAEVRCVAGMDEAVLAAAATARSGDRVLLSPACASLDMYPNFAARGDHFSRAVGRLAA